MRVAIDDALWSGTALSVADPAGHPVTFDVARWSAGADHADQSMLDRCHGPTLDVGCGPGRLVRALGARGIPALGVDVAAAAVALARSGGALTLRRSIFDRVPGCGRWSAAILADGNIGIGGDPAALLVRLRELLAPQAALIVEVESAEVAQRFTATMRDPRGVVLGTFPWVRVGAAAVTDIAEGCGFGVAERWDSNDRRFVSLHRT